MWVLNRAQKGCFLKRTRIVSRLAFYGLRISEKIGGVWPLGSIAAPVLTCGDCDAERPGGDYSDGWKTESCGWSDTGKLNYDIYRRSLQVCFSGVWQSILQHTGKQWSLSPHISRYVFFLLKIKTRLYPFSFFQHLNSNTQD